MSRAKHPVRTFNLRKIRSTTGGRPSTARGVTLIEVLVAVLVLSVGLLGYAALLAFSLQANQSANFRTQATVLAYEALDMIRSSRSNVQFFRRDWNWTAPSASGPNATLVGTAIADVSNWSGRVATALPGGQARIEPLASPIPPAGFVGPPPTGAPADRGVVIIQLRWSDARWQATDPERTTQFEVRSRI